MVTDQECAIAIIEGEVAEFFPVVQRAALTIRRFDERHPDATDEARRQVVRRALLRVYRHIERQYGGSKKKAGRVA